MYWTIDGKDIVKSIDVDLGASRSNKVIPQSEIKAVAGNDPYVPLSLKHNGDFGFKGILNIPIEDYDGKYANLYSYTDNQLELLGHTKISEGYMRFAFRRASDCLIVIRSQSHGEDISFDISAYIGDDVSADAGVYLDGEMVKDAVPVIGIIVPISVSAVFIMKLRRKRNG